MPVRKFRTVEDMDAEVWRVPGDPALYRAIAALWALGRRTSRLSFPPGVHKHRSIEELNETTMAWQRANVARRRMHE